jgi:hypothetical protein
LSTELAESPLRSHCSEDWNSANSIHERLINPKMHLLVWLDFFTGFCDLSKTTAHLCMPLDWSFHEALPRHIKQPVPLLILRALRGASEVLTRPPKLEKVETLDKKQISTTQVMQEK